MISRIFLLKNKGYLDLKLKYYLSVMIIFELKRLTSCFKKYHNENNWKKKIKIKNKHNLLLDILFLSHFIFDQNGCK